MATKLQLELFRANPKFIYLAELMAQQVYPKIVDSLRKLGMQEVRCGKVEGWKSFSILIEGKIQFFSFCTEGNQQRKTSHYELDFLGKKICPLFLDENGSSTEEFESPFKNYKLFCESVLNQVDILENCFFEAQNIISRIEKIGFSLEKRVITEKYKNNV